MHIPMNRARSGFAMLQGSRRAHEVAIRAACDLTNTSVSMGELRSLGDLNSGGLDAVILPGGESTMRIVGGEGGTASGRYTRS